MIVYSVSEAVLAFGARGASWLAPSEEAERRRLSIEKRHDEWLAGRLAAKRAAQLETGLPFDRLVIRRSLAAQNRGQPELRIDDRGDPIGFLSISHSSGFAAALLSATPVGIDLERILNPEPSLLDLALSARERAELEARAEDERSTEFTRVWCAKEAYAKWLGRGFARPLPSLEPASDPRVTIELGVLEAEPTIVWARASSKLEAKF